MAMEEQILMLASVQPQVYLNIHASFSVSPTYLWTCTGIYMCLLYTPEHRHTKHLNVSPLFTWIRTHIHMCPVNVPEQTHICLYLHMHLNIQTYLHVSLTCTWTYAHIYMSHMCTWTYKHIYIYLLWEPKYAHTWTYIHTSYILTCVYREDYIKSEFSVNACYYSMKETEKEQ